MTEFCRVVPASATTGPTAAAWLWDARCPVVVRLQVEGGEAVLGRDALEDLLAQLDCAAPTAVVRVGEVELSAVRSRNGLQVLGAPGIDRRVIVDLRASWDFVAETLLWTAPCPGDDCRPMCPEHRALAVWGDVASWRLTAGWSV